MLRLVPEAWTDVTASLLANLIAIAGLVLWVRALEPAFGRREARWGVAFVAFAPSSFVLSMAYSEPLFLLACGRVLPGTRTDPAQRPLAGGARPGHARDRLRGGASTLPALVR